MKNEDVTWFCYNNYRVNIFAEDANKEDTGFYFTVTPYDENNIPSGYPIYNSSKDYICETYEQAKEDAKDWIDDYDNLYF